MPKVKIISDPYSRHTRFELWNDGWASITGDNNPNSALRAKKYTEGFFPFKAQEIVRALVKEYAIAIAPLEIAFEGPDDEWIVLETVCATEDFAGKVNLEPRQRALANASDILPLIRSSFEEISPIVMAQNDGSQGMQELLRKFKEASSDVVPIVVVGNYSSGKSTFINALIGAELLPSGNEPITARIYKIGRSERSNSGSIQFKIDGISATIGFSAQETRVEYPAQDNALIASLKQAFAEIQDATVVARMRTAILAINSFIKGPNEHAVSDLIEVTVPFGKDSEWAEGRRIAIFDTPGSNSSSNIDHRRVLEDGMRGMSDGLPIYVVKYDSLATNDNADLVKMIQEIPVLDERFAMVVVNRADEADLPVERLTEDEEDEVMESLVVRELYAQGVFFASSIVALGAKTDGVFSDRHYGRVFRRLKDSYEDSSDEDYTRLYSYDLMPDQLQENMAHEAETCPNTLLANSGIFSVERGIETFADTYSAYNKCFLSGQFLHELIEQTDLALQTKQQWVESSRRELENSFAESRAGLLAALNQQMVEVRLGATTGYYPYMSEWAKRALPESELTMERLSGWEQDITARKRKEKNADETRNEADDKRTAIVANFSQKAQDVWDTKNFLGFGAVLQGLAGDIGAALEADGKAGAIFRGADREASEELLWQVRGEFQTVIMRLSHEADECSQKYWEERARASRKALLDFVTEGEDIDDTRREALRRTIINYQDLTFDAVKPELLVLRYPFDPNKLWKEPLSFQYNMELRKRVSMWRDAIGPIHSGCYHNWLNTLMGELENNVVDLNPELRRKMDELRGVEREIEDLKAKRMRLHEVEERVSHFMEWKEA